MNDCQRCGYPGGRHITHLCSYPGSFPIPPRAPVCCPVCQGRGIVVRGFYDFTDTIPATGTGASEPCRACGGRGIV